ncbi:MAG: ribose 5-phosphate isomerase B [Caldilineales bacterium]
MAPVEAEVRALVRATLQRLLDQPGAAAPAARPVIDAATVAQTAPGSTLDLPAGALITPLARELALERGITLGAAQPLPQVQGAAERTIAIGADHGGYALKEQLKPLLEKLGWQVADCGCHSSAAVDYPDFAFAVARMVSEQRARWGIMIDGAGIGSCMVANKVPGVRAALCYDQSTALNSREHNHANVLTLGAGLIGPALAQQIVKTWLETPFGPDRHAKRVEKIMQIERRFSKGSGKQ